MGCNQSKTKSAKKKKDEKAKSRNGTEAGEMMVSEVNRPPTAADVPAEQPSDARTSQAAREAGSEGQHASAADQPNAATQSEETTYDNLQSASEQARLSQGRRSAGASAAAENDAELKEGEAAAAAAAPSDARYSAADGAQTPPISPHPAENGEDEDAAAAAAADNGNDDANDSDTTPGLDATSAPAGMAAADAEPQPASADAPEEGAAAADATHHDETSEQSDVDFQVMTEDPATHDDAPTFHEELQTPGADAEEAAEEAEQHGAPTPSSGAPSTPHFETEDADAAPSPPFHATSDAEAVTPTAQEQAPEPTPQPRTERSSASHSRSGAPMLHTAAREEKRRQSFLSSMGGSEANTSPMARRGQRKLSQTSSTGQRKARQERPPWVDVVPPPVEQEAEEAEPHSAYTHEASHASSPMVSAAPPHVEQIDADIGTPSAQRSEQQHQPSSHASQEHSAPRSAVRESPPASAYQTYRTPSSAADAAPAAAAMPPPYDTASEEDEEAPVIPEAALPAETPKERMAARRRRNSAAAAEVITAHSAAAPPPMYATATHEDPSRPRTPRPHRQAQRTQTSVAPSAPVPPQHQQLLRPPVVSPIPFRAAYTDPSPAAETAASTQHRAPTTQMPPPTAYYMDGPNRSPRRLSLDPSVMAAIETSTSALVRAHTPIAPGSSNHSPNGVNRGAAAQRALPPSTLDAAAYRDPGKLPPSHLMDPVYGPAAAGESRRLYGGDAAAGGRPASSGGAPGSANGNAGRTPAAVVAGPRSAASSRNAPSAPPSRKAAPASRDYGAHRYGDEVDEVEDPHQHQPAYRNPYADAVQSRSGFEPLYSAQQGPRGGSAQPYEPSLTDEAPANAAVLRAGAQASSSHGGRSNGGAAGGAAPSSKPSSAMWSPADGPSLQGDDEEEEPNHYEEAEEQDGAYADPAEDEPSGEPEAYEEGDDDDYEQEGGDGDAADGDAPPPPPEDADYAGETAVAAVPGNDGYVVERQEPEWQLLNPPPEENKNLYQQAKFVAQMRNVTPI